MPESQTALNFNLKFANINFLRVRKQSRRRNLDIFNEQKNSSSSTKRYFQGNSEARRPEIIKKWGVGFQDDKNLSPLLIFDSNI